MSNIIYQFMLCIVPNGKKALHTLLMGCLVFASSCIHAQFADNGVGGASEEQNRGLKEKATYIMIDTIDAKKIKDILFLSFSDAAQSILFLKTDQYSFVMNYCSGEILLDSIVLFSISKEYISSMVFKTAKHWTLIQSGMLDKEGWKPFSIDLADYDEISPLERESFILKKGDQSWYGKIIRHEDRYELVKMYTPISGRTVYDGNGGFLAQCSESGKKFFRVFKFPSDSLLSEVAENPNMNATLHWTSSIKADSIELISDYNNSMIFQQGGVKYFYSFEKDSILDTGFTEYYPESRFNRAVIKKDGYLGCFTHPGYGSTYKKLNFPNLKGTHIFKWPSDAFLGYVTTTDGKEYYYNFDGGEPMDSMVVSPELQRLIPNGHPYLRRTFDKLKTGEFCFLDSKSKKMLVQSPQGTNVMQIDLDYAAQNSYMTALAHNDFWYINPISYFYPDTSFVVMHNRSKYDKIIPLEYDAYLGIRGEQKWFVNYNEAESKYHAPVPVEFKGDKFVDSGAGLIIDISESSKPDLRFIKYHSRIFRLCCNPKTGQWEQIPLTCRPTEGFEADTILLYAQQTDEEMIVYSRNGEVFAYDIDDEIIYRIKDGKYAVSPIDDRVVFLSGDYLFLHGSYGSEKHYVPGAIDFTLKPMGRQLITTVDFGGGKIVTKILNKSIKCDAMQ